ncbi:MAG: hypothetical protein M3R55_03790 [Acidobacteriota bacterium]|nr:hypothetical protein [Acidobacteriota bacterium]
MVRHGVWVTAGLWLLLAVAGGAQQPKKKLPKPPPMPTSYDVKGLGLGKLSTVVVAMASDCKACLDAVPFYKTLLALPGMDGKARRLVVVAMDGVWPVKFKTDAAKFTPHRLTSGPYPGLDFPGVRRAPTIVVLDAAGKQRGAWAGPLTPEQQKAVIAAAMAR